VYKAMCIAPLLLVSHIMTFIWQFKEVAKAAAR